MAQQGPTFRRGRRPRRGRSDFGPRLLVAVPAVVVAVLLIVQGGEVFALGILLLGLLGMHELYELFADLRPVRLAGFIALIALIAAALYGGGFDVLLFAALSLPLVFLLALLSPVRDGVSLSILITLLGIIWIGLALAHAVLLRELPHGEGVLIGVLIGTFIGDTGAYFGGRMFGRRPLTPRISPNKTVEGLIAGMVAAVAAVWFTGLYEDWLGGNEALLLGVGVAIAAPVGDLFESLLKRDADSKDSGRAFGAHGGVLDRLDAPFLTVIVGYYIWVGLM